MALDMCLIMFIVVICNRGLSDTLLHSMFYTCYCQNNISLTEAGVMHEARYVSPM